jgi:hypothetical protein
MQYPAIVGNTGNRKLSVYAVSANPRNALIVSPNETRSAIRVCSNGFTATGLIRTGAKEATLRAAHRLSVLGLSFLALAMIGAIFLITDVLVGGVVATVATVAICAVFAWVWYGQPLLRLRD